MTPFALTVIFLAELAAGEATARYPDVPPSQAERLLDATIAEMRFERNAAAMRCIRAHRRFIIESVIEAERVHSVPPAVLIVTAASESHLGCTRADGRSSWGSPVSRNRRNVAGGPMHSARDLATSRRRCGSWPAARGRYRYGRCGLGVPSYGRGYTPRLAVHLIRRVHARAGLPLPEGFAP